MHGGGFADDDGVDTDCGVEDVKGHDDDGDSLSTPPPSPSSSAVLSINMITLSCRSHKLEDAPTRETAKTNQIRHAFLTVAIVWPSGFLSAGAL